MKSSVKVSSILEFLREDFDRVPSIRVVCSRCDGEGKHVNPSIDYNGISPDEFAEDPDFEEAYFEGRYDVTCEECDGCRVIEKPDYENLSPEQKKAFDEHQAADDEHRRWVRACNEGRGW